MLIDSWKGPAFEAPSPKKDTATRPLPSSWAARPAPVTIGNTTGDDAVSAQHTDAEISDVHGAAFAFAVAGLSAVKFSHHPIQIGTLGEAVPVTAVGADDLVVSVQRRAHSHGDSFLTDVAVHDAVDGTRLIVVRCTLLEATDGLHRAEHLKLL